MGDFISKARHDAMFFAISKTRLLAYAPRSEISHLTAKELRIYRDPAMSYSYYINTYTRSLSRRERKV